MPDEPRDTTTEPGEGPEVSALVEQVETVASGRDFTEVWREALTRIDNGQILTNGQRAFLVDARPVGMLESTAIVAVGDDFAKEQLETRLKTVLVASLSEVVGTEVQLIVNVDAAVTLVGTSSEDPPSAEPELNSGLAGSDLAGSGGDGTELAAERFGRPPVTEAVVHPRSAEAEEVRRHRAGVMPTSAEASRLNPKYTFDTFVIGSSNRFAHAAAVAVAEAPAQAYNPLFIYGESGLGKTHLLHAIGNYVRSISGKSVLYVSSEEFTNDFINSIRDDKASAFQHRYRAIDVLLVDDIQFLQGKVQTQEEFFHTFNTLHNANKQIVITSDLPPKQLQAFEDRMRSRFEWGLLTDVQPPDLETRIAILRKKAAQEHLVAPDDVLEYIASKIATNIRELEGALIRVTAFASLNKQQVDVGLAELVLKDLITESGVPEITLSLIMAQTAQYFDVSIDDLQGTSRSRVLVTARQISMYLCRELTDLSLPKIGQQFGGRDHTTVMHAERKIRSLMSERRQIYNQVTELTNRIKQHARQL